MKTPAHTNKPTSKLSARNTADSHCNADWVLGLLIIIIIVIVLFIFEPKYQKQIDNFINLDLKFQSPGGTYSGTETKLIKWNADNYQKIQLVFSNSTNTISRVKLDFKDVANNNLYTYSAENNDGKRTAFDFNLNLPAPKTYMLYIYINNDTQPTFISYIETTDTFFNFTDINGNLMSANDVGSTLKITIKNPEKTNQVSTQPNTNLGLLKMQPYNLVNIPIEIPKLSEYKNKLKAITSVDPEIKAKHDQKIGALDNFVFKEIEAKIIVIKLPTTMSTSNLSTGDEFEIKSLSPSELEKFEKLYPNPPKVNTPGVDGCIQGDSNKCMLVAKNLVNDTKYRIDLRAVYQQLGVIEPNIRYTETQKIIFSVSNLTNKAADLNESININIDDIGRKYVLNREQKEFIKRDQSRQDNLMTGLESEITQLGTRIYNVL